MPVPTTLRGISLTAASNSPAGTDVIGSSLDDYLRSIQTVFRQYLAAPATNIASAATTDLSTADGFYVAITGTTTITSFGTEQAGIHYLLKFTGALTLTHNATSLIIPGGQNITTVAGDMAWAISEGSGNWRIAFVNRASAPWTTLSTEQASTSGTAINFTGIPAGVKEIKVHFNGVSTNGTSAVLIQVGDSGGIENSGYASSSVAFASSAVFGPGSSGSGFVVANAFAATTVINGIATLCLEDASDFTWTMASSVADTNGPNVFVGAGAKALSAELDRVRITTASGDTFDAGAINISYRF